MQDALGDFHPRPATIMKPLLLLPIPALALLLSSCVVDPGGYGYDPGYYDGYYGAGYYGGGYYVNDHHHHHRGSGRIYGKPWSSYDDVRLNAGHRTSPNYRDPHNGGISHNHDARGNRIDSRGHPVDAVGNHTGGSRSGGSGHHDHGTRPSGGRSGPSSSPPPAVATSPPPSRPAPPPSGSSSSGSVRNDKAFHAQSRR
jgi:hypothetical protein